MDDEETRDEFDGDAPKKNIPDPLGEDDVDGTSDEIKETDIEEDDYSDDDEE